MRPARQGAEIIDYETFGAFLETFDCQPDPFPELAGPYRGFWPSAHCEHWVYRGADWSERQEGLFVDHAGHYVFRVLECNGIAVNPVILDAAQASIPSTPIATESGCPAFEVDLAAGKYPLRFDFSGSVGGVFYVDIKEVTP